MAGKASSGINYNYFMLLLCQSIGAVMDRPGVERCNLSNGVLAFVLLLTCGGDLERSPLK